ncbi:hypothetical protein D9M71_675520 [compost metagenome]
MVGCLLVLIGVIQGVRVLAQRLINEDFVRANMTKSAVTNLVSNDEQLPSPRCAPLGQNDYGPAIYCSDHTVHLGKTLPNMIQIDHWHTMSPACLQRIAQS